MRYTANPAYVEGWRGHASGLWPWVATRRIGQVLAFAVKLLAGLFAVGAVGLIAGFFLFVSAVPRSGATLLEPADGIVVLTGGAQRVDDAVALLADGRARRLLVSGVFARTTRAQLASQNPGAGDLFGCCIDLDYRARNTIGNAIETRRWAREHDFRTLIVVTSNYHMPRALVEMRSILGDYELKPHAVITGSVDPDTWWRSAATARLLMSEYGKYLVALVRTRLESDPEYAPMALMAGGRKPLHARTFFR